MLLRIKDAHEEIARLTADLETAKESARTNSEALLAVMGERDTIKDAAATAATALVEATHRIEALETAQADANGKALDIVAQAGFPAPVAVAPEPPDLFAQLNALPHGAARQQFLLRHWNQLSQPKN